MTPLLNQVFQIAYVTNDLDRAARVFLDRYGTGEFLFMRDIPIMELGLAYAGDTMIELIQPKDGSPAFYTDWIAGTAGFALRHHHFGILIDDEQEWSAMRNRYVERQTPIAMEGETEDLAYLYADTTADLGHYLEYIRLYEGGRQHFASIPGSPFAR